MDYLDFELKIGAGSGPVYPVEVVRSPAGERNATMQFPYDALELESRLKDIKIALLKSSSTRRDMMAPVEERQSVEDFGRTLFSALLPDEIRTCYRLSREKAQQQGKGLRLRLRIEAPDLAVLPWEFLYDEAEGDFVCLSRETPLIRYLDLDRPPEPLLIEPPLRILGMVASPDELPALNVEREKERIETALQELTRRGRVSITWLEGQSWRALQRAMRGGPWHVFHFIGHGGFDPLAGEGTLALADEDGRIFRLGATKLGRLLADHNSLRLVILNACKGAQASETDIFSSTASMLVRRGVPAVVAMQYEISDQAAIEFSRVFAEALADGLAVDAAVVEARKAISLAGGETVEWGTPVMYLRTPDGRLFNIDAEAMPALVQAAPRPAKPQAASPPPAAPPRRKTWMYLAGGLALGVVIALSVVLMRTDPKGEEILKNASDTATQYQSVDQLLQGMGLNAGHNAYHAARLMAGRIQTRGFSFAGSVMHRLGEGEREGLPLDVEDGYSYKVVGFCDDTCTDLDLGLYNEQDTLMLQDIAEDNTPLLEFNALETGTYEVGVAMVTCASGQCAYGVVVYQQKTPDGALAAPDAPPATPAEAAPEQSESTPTVSDARTSSLRKLSLYTQKDPATGETTNLFTSVTAFDPDTGYVEDSVEGCVLVDEMPDTKPLYWFMQDGNTSGTFVSTTKDSVNGVFSDGSKVGYVFTTRKDGTIPLTLLLYEVETIQDVVAAVTPAFKDLLQSAGYRELRIEGYVYPASRCE